MIAYLNGRFLPEEQALVSIHDRGFLYGDGLFETMRVYGGEPFLWGDHMERFAAGCELLKIAPQLSPGELRQVIAHLLRQNRLENAVVRVTLSRGIGKRGYSPNGAENPTLAIAAFPVPENSSRAIRLRTSSFRLPDRDPLADYKHLNKLRQVLARAEADATEAQEALLLNKSGSVIEGASSNLFWISDGAVCTAPVQGILPGTTRKHILELCRALGLKLREEHISLANLMRAEGVFVTSSVLEITPVGEIDGQRINRSAIVGRLKRAYRKS